MEGPKPDIDEKNKNRIKQLEDSKEKYSLVIFHPEYDINGTKLYFIPMKGLSEHERDILLDSNSRVAKVEIFKFIKGDRFTDDESHSGESELEDDDDIDWIPYEYSYKDLLAVGKLDICINRVIILDCDYVI